MRKLMSMLFILMLSVQLLPVREVGARIWSAQPSEEEVVQQNPLSKIVSDNKLWYLTFDLLSDQFDSQSEHPFIILDEALIKCFHLEVLTEPPDLNC